MSGATTGKIGVYNDEDNAFLNQGVGVFRVKNNLNYEYLVQYLFSTNFKKQINSVLVAGAQPNISGKDIANFKFFLPNLDEQKNS